MLIDGRRAGFALAVLLPFIAAVLPSLARGQADVLPGSERPELKPFEPEIEAPAALDLPPIPVLEDEGSAGLSMGLRVFVKAFRFEGSSVFSEEELERLTAPFSGRQISSEELLRARDAITDHYNDHGYLTSGAYIPDQDAADGIVAIRVVEGVLTDVEIEGVRRFRPGYFGTRLRRAARAPVNVNEIEAQLQLFHRDPRVARVNAQLLPGARRGESVLFLNVEENPFYGLDLSAANDNSPGVGSYTGYIEPHLSNLIGYGDEWRSQIQISEGLRQYDSSFSIPLPPFDTRLALHYQRSRGDVVEEPFDDIDIESRSDTYGITLDQPLLRLRNNEIRVGVTGEWRTSKTTLLDTCFSFAIGTDDCKTKVSVLRSFAGWTWSTPNFVVAARATWSIGFHAFGSTDRPSPLADSKFVSWLAQVQWAHRLPDEWLGTEIVARFDTQLASDALVAIEKFSVGGMRTVRGYRENQFVRDNGLVASVEFRIPIWRNNRGRALVQLAPFFDYGRSWDEEFITKKQEIASVGVGIRLSPWEWLHGELYWGGRLKKAPKTGDDIQNDGIHFAIYITPF
jgi:hemolysin activation/secretion protein